MKSKKAKKFCIWLNGYLAALNDVHPERSMQENIEAIKDKLEELDEDGTYRFIMPSGGPRAD